MSDTENLQAARSGVIAAGNWIVDQVKTIDTWPPQDALATIVDESYGNGGGAYNLLKNLGRLGARFPLLGVGLVGDDAAGARILADCRAHGIDATQLRVTTEAPTSYTDVMTVRDTGRRTFFHQRGANARLGPEAIDFTGTTARIFFLGYLLLLDRLDAIHDGLPAAREVFARAHAAGLLTALDMVSDTSDRFVPVILPVLPFVDYVFANDFEAEKLTGVALRPGNVLDPSGVVAAAERILQLGARSWVILHFPEGALACGRHGERFWQGSVRVPTGDIRGAAGAGDAFAAGVLFGVHAGWPMAQSLELGVCTAAACLYHPTCSDAVRACAECLELGQRFGFRPALADAVSFS